MKLDEYEQRVAIAAETARTNGLDATYEALVELLAAIKVSNSALARSVGPQRMLH